MKNMRKRRLQSLQRETPGDGADGKASTTSKRKEQLVYKMKETGDECGLLPSEQLGQLTRRRGRGQEETLLI